MAGRSLRWNRSANAGLIAVLLFAATACAPAQDAPQPEVKPALPAQPAQEPSQTARPANGVAPALPPQEQKPVPGQSPTQPPGAGAQVQTGSQIGEGSLRNLANRLAALLGDHQFEEMEQLLDSSERASDSPESKLPPEKIRLYRGVLANRENKLQQSIQQLEPLLDSNQSNAGPALTPEDEKLARKTLAQDYLRAGDWAKAAQAYKTLQSKGNLTPAEQEENELPLKLLPLVAGNPPTSVEAGDAFDLPYDRDALGLLDVPVFVDAQSHDWMLDPTSPFNLICRSTAKSVGLRMSEESAIVHTITGRPMEVHATVIPRFTLGTVTYRNMTAFVFEDADYFFPQAGYQVRGVLGFPAVSALGSITVANDARIEVQPGAKGQRLANGAPFYLDGDRVIVDLGNSEVAGDARAYVVDVAGQQTYLSSRYFAEHAGDFAGQKMTLINPPGLGGKPPVPAYLAQSVSLQAGSMPLNLNSIEVLTEPLGNAAVDDTYGTLGLDALDDLKSYTFDYRTMRFGVRSE